MRPQKKRPRFERCPRVELGSPAGVEAIQHRQQFGRIRALRIVRIDFGIGDDAVGADHKARRHRQHPGRIVVEGRQVVLEALVELDQIILQRKADAERVGDFAFDVAQDREAELVVALRLAAVRRRLRRDRNQACAAGDDFRKRRLQRLQLHIAVRAPDAAIERKHQRSSRE